MEELEDFGVFTLGEFRASCHDGVESTVGFLLLVAEVDLLAVDVAVVEVSIGTITDLGGSGHWANSAGVRVTETLAFSA